MKNMTSGHPLKLILLFAMPVLLGQLFQSLYMIGDLVVVGRLLGIEALAALGSMVPVFAVLQMMSFGFTSGLSVIIAQRFGADDRAGICRSYAVGLILSVIFAVIAMGVFIPSLNFILKGMNVPEDISDLAYSFIETLIWGISGLVFYNYLSNVLRALGDSKTPLYFLMFTSLLNLALNILFITVFNLGVRGSALGSVCAQMISVFLCAGYIFFKYPILRIGCADFKTTAQFVYAHVRLGFPTSLQFSLIGLGALVTQSVCNQFGLNAIAAMVTSLRIEQLFALPMFSLGPSMVVFAAQNFGACRIRRIRTGVLQASVFSFCTSLVLTGIVYFWGKQIILLFLENPNLEMIELSHQYLQITTLFYFFLGQIFVFRQTLQGIGQPLVPLISGVVELSMRIGAAILLASWFGFSGLCFASPAAWIGGSAVVAIGYLYYVRRLPLYCLTKAKQMEAGRLEVGRVESLI